MAAAAAAAVVVVVVVVAMVLVRAAELCTLAGCLQDTHATAALLLVKRGF